MSTDIEFLLEDYMEDHNNNIECIKTSPTWNAFIQEPENKMYTSWFQTIYV